MAKYQTGFRECIDVSIKIRADVPESVEQRVVHAQ